MFTISQLKHTLIATSLTIMLSACGGSASQPTQTQAESTTPAPFDFQQLINDKITTDVPGIILLVDTPEREFLGSAGVSNIEFNTPMQPTDVFHAASAGKIFTALLAVKLHQEGLLNLDATLDTWLAEDLLNQIQYSDEITLRQLLNHSSGVYNYSDEEAYVEDGLNFPDKQRGNFDLTAFALNKPAYFEPGTSVHYSNTNYTLAGMVLDKVLGYSNSMAMRDKIISPLSLTDTFFVGHENQRGELIPGYETFHGQKINTGPILSNYAVNSTPMASSVNDLAHLTRSLFTDEAFANPELRELLWGAESLVIEPSNEGDEFSYALGLFKTQVNGKTVYLHDGANHGYLTQNMYFPDSDTSVVFFLNCGLSDPCIDAFHSLRANIITQVTK